MKKFMSLLVLAIAFQVSYAQPSPSSNPNSGQATIILADQSTVTGEITDNIRKKGELSLVVNGKKTKYKAGDISEVKTTAGRFISINYTFYEVIYSGKKITLLRKASEPSGVQYNGSDAVVISSQGDIDDLFVKNSNGSLQLLTKKNARQVLGDCAGDIAKLDAAVAKTVAEGCDK